MATINVAKGSEKFILQCDQVSPRHTPNGCPGKYQWVYYTIYKKETPN